MKSVFSFRLDDVGYKMLLSLSEKFNESRASILRRLITKEFFARGIDLLEREGLLSHSEMEGRHLDTESLSMVEGHKKCLPIPNQEASHVNEKLK